MAESGFGTMNEALTSSEAQQRFAEMQRLDGDRASESAFALYGPDQTGRYVFSDLLTPDTRQYADTNPGEYRVFRLDPSVTSLVADVSVPNVTPEDLPAVSVDQWASAGALEAIRLVREQFGTDADVIDSLISLERFVILSRPARYRDDVALLCRSKALFRPVQKEVGEVLWPVDSDLEEFGRLRDASRHVIGATMASAGDDHRLLVYGAAAGPMGMKRRLAEAYKEFEIDYTFHEHDYRGRWLLEGVGLEWAELELDASGAIAERGRPALAEFLGSIGLR
jgi:hypothetical protein